MNTLHTTSKTPPLCAEPCAVHLSVGATHCTVLQWVVGANALQATPGPPPREYSTSCSRIRGNPLAALHHGGLLSNKVRKVEAVRDMAASTTEEAYKSSSDLNDTMERLAKPTIQHAMHISMSNDLSPIWVVWTSSLGRLVHSVAVTRSGDSSGYSYVRMLMFSTVSTLRIRCTLGILASRIFFSCSLVPPSRDTML